MKSLGVTWAAAFTALALQIFSPSAFAQSCPHQTPCELRVGWFRSMTNINPQTAAGGNNINILINSFEGLLATDASGNLIPGQAERWERSQDGLTYTFFLRENARWSDGSPVTASNFVDSWRLAFGERNSVQSILLDAVVNAKLIRAGKLSPQHLGIRALNDKTIEIKLEYPQSFFLTILSNPRLSALPLHRLENHQFRTDWNDPSGIVFNGPYTIASPTMNTQLILRKNPHYHSADNVYFDSVTIDSSRENDRILVAKFLSGNLDLVYEVKPEDLSLVAQSDAHHIVEDLNAAVAYLLFNFDNPALQSKAVRQALTISLPFATLDQFYGTSEPLGTLLPSSIEGYPATAFVPKTREAPLTQRLETARTILEAEGYNADNPLRISLNTASLQTQGVGEVLQKLWQKIHVELQLERNSDSVHYQQHMYTGAFDLGEVSMVAYYNDAYNFLTQFQTRGHFNLGGWSHERYDTLLAEYQTARTVLERDAIVNEMLEIVHHERPLIPLFTISLHSLIATDINGFEPSVMSWHPFRFMSRRPSN